VFEDEGHSGSTLVCPALERLRDVVAGVGVDVDVDVVLVYSPDRLARKFAYQALLIEEFARAGTRVEFVNGPRGDSPEDQDTTDAATWRQLRRQRGRCPLCPGLLLHADREPQGPREWEQWLTATRRAIRKHAIRLSRGPWYAGRTRRTPPHTRPLLPTQRRQRPSNFARLEAFRACLSRLLGKRARPVLRRGRRGNAPSLPDERWFDLLTEQRLRRGVHKTLRALENDIRDWTRTWNENPRPFAWTKTADEIIDHRTPRLIS
jgi:hypothetical protein